MPAMLYNAAIRFIQQNEPVIGPARVRSHANRTMAVLYFVSAHAPRFIATGHLSQDGAISRRLLEALSVLPFDLPPARELPSPGLFDLPDGFGATLA